MKKSLLLAALLLSSAAQAETYVCREEVLVNLNAEDGQLTVSDYKSRNELGGILIIDTSRGYKIGDSWFESECKNTAETVVTCEDSTLGRTKLTVTEEDGRLSFLMVNTLLERIAVLSSGYCFKDIPNLLRI
jgi:hypothetical protein